MGMFGSIGKFFGDLKTPGADGLTTADKLAYMASGFGDPEDFARGTQIIGAKRAAYQKQATQADFEKLLAGKLGPQYQNGPDPTVNIPSVTGSGALRGFMSQDTLPQVQAPPPGAIGESLPGQPTSAPYQYQPPRKISDGLTANSPELPQLVMAAQKAGYSMDDVLKVLQMQQPDVRYDRGFGSNSKTGAAMGGYHPDLDKGQEPVFDQNGRIVGVRNMDGAIQSASDMAGAVKGAEARAQAPYQAVQTQDASGRPMTINAAQLAGGANGQGAPFVGQSPAQTAADTATATAGANANIALPQSQADAQQAVQLIQTLKANPALPKRTGAYSLLPALPGTPGAAFDAADDQLRGKLFMQAYAGLKGGGQITEVEGKKATQAIARLSRSQSSKDYIAALNDLQSVIQSGLTRAQQQPGRLQPNASGGHPAASPGRSAIEAEMRRRGLIQ